MSPFHWIKISSFFLCLTFAEGATREFTELEVAWRDSAQRELAIGATFSSSSLAGCVDGGLTLVFALQGEICSKRSWWVDRCRGLIQQESKLNFDRIQERHITLVDIIGDGRVAKKYESELFEDALAPVLSSRVKIPKDRDESSYVLLKATIECRGAGSSTVQEMVNILTFGLVSPMISDTGWNRYNLE